MHLHKFTEYGEIGTMLLLSDSTNSERWLTYSEKEVACIFEDIFSSA